MTTLELINSIPSDVRDFINKAGLALAVQKATYTGPETQLINYFRVELLDGYFLSREELLALLECPRFLYVHTNGDGRLVLRFDTTGIKR